LQDKRIRLPAGATLNSPSAFEQEAQKRDHGKHTDPEEAELSCASGRMFVMSRNLMVVIQDRHKQSPNPFTTRES
jgi:hypothetical protein